MQDFRWPTYATRNLALDGGVAERAEPGRGSFYVRDVDGKIYLDGVNGIGCAPLGHGHPRWVAAIEAQAKKLATAAGTFWTEPNRELVARLRERVPMPDARAFVGNTGTEVTEAAIKLSLRARPGRTVIVAADRAFHGRTLGAIALTATPKYREPYVSCIGEADDRFARMNVARVPFGDLDAATETFARYGERIAAMFIEPVQGEAGIYPATREYLVGLRELCNRHDALLGADEIQCGSGRSGTFTAWSTLVGDDPQTAPDIMWFAKAIGGGVPLAACVTTAPLAEHMGRGTHGSTFGGNPLACAAAVATLSIMDDEGLLGSAGQQLATMQAIAGETPHPRVVQVRGLGAMIGIEVTGGDQAGMPVADAAQRYGLLATVCHGKTIRLLLPYGAGRPQLVEAWSILQRALEDQS